MKPVERILEALKQGSFTAKQIQQITGCQNIHVILNYLTKKNKIKKEKTEKTIESNGPKAVYLYSLTETVAVAETGTEAVETASQDA